MNERIQELIRLSAVPADQAEDYAEAKGLIEPAEKLDVAKFAKLIVRECAGVTLDYKNNDHYTGWCDHAEEILRHFGVEK